MKKTLSTALIVTLCLVVFFTQAFAAAPADSGPKPKQTPNAGETQKLDNGAKPEKEKPEKEKPGAEKEHPGRKYNFKGEVASFDGATLVIEGRRGGTVTVDASTTIRFAGPKQTEATIQPGQRVMAQAAKTETGFLALRVHVFPTKPARVHRVGVVTAYDGQTITVEGKNGTTTFQIAQGAKILPAGRAESLGLGSRVTIISPASASKDTPTATGIVVHPEKDGD